MWLLAETAGPCFIVIQCVQDAGRDEVLVFLGQRLNTFERFIEKDGHALKIPRSGNPGCTLPLLPRLPVHQQRNRRGRGVAEFHVPEESDVARHVAGRAEHAAGEVRGKQFHWLTGDESTAARDIYESLTDTMAELDGSLALGDLCARAAIRIRQLTALTG